MVETDENLATRRRRALYRATHRGTKEMDWILGRFARAELPAMNADELAVFETLLSLPDPDIENWVKFGMPDGQGGDVAGLINQVRRFHAIGNAGGP